LRVGGLALVGAGALSVVLLAIVVAVAGGAPPRDAERVVDLVARHGRLIEAVAVIYLVVDLCLVVARRCCTPRSPPLTAPGRCWPACWPASASSPT
jgi:hypothetical protein